MFYYKNVNNSQQMDNGIYWLTKVRNLRYSNTTKIIINRDNMILKMVKEQLIQIYR